MIQRESLDLWLKKLDPESEYARELILIKDDEAAINDRFWRDLEFGTGGIRGEIGVGTNRMNIFTVGKATQGLAGFLLLRSNSPSAVIAYDTRNFSREFAECAACVLCANGVRVFLFEDVHPTPMLSFAVRHFGADAGIVITASHNPKQYNGYKVYGTEGGQITDAAAAEILEHISACDIFSGVKSIPLEKAKTSGLLQIIGEDVDSAYFAKVKSLCMRGELIAEKAGGLKILYSPLHGSGNTPVRRTLRELGFSDVSVVKEQELPDGNFPTAPYPNPENPEVFGLAVKVAEKTDPDLIFATDPDCDRIGVLCKTPAGKYEVLTGNQMGALLCEYMLSAKREFGILPKNAAVVKTIVTTELARAICDEYGVSLIDVLTGFKYIGEKIGEWEKSGEYYFVFGFEESYGYLAGDFVRDKDAVIAACLIAEMALYYKELGMSLYSALQEIYEKYGYYKEKLISVSMPGQKGQEKIAEIIANLRESCAEAFVSQNLAVFEDYGISKRTVIAADETNEINLPESNVLKFIFADESQLVLRPSGTEPKMKLYLGVRGKNADEAENRLEVLEKLANKVIGV